MPTTSVSAQEQLLLELINRARLDPSGEAARFGISLNEGLAAGTISSAAKAPLAFDLDLNESSANHSSWMLNQDVFSHTGSGGSSSDNRMRSAGYDFEGSWGSGENLSWRGTTGTLNVTTSIYEQHKSLFLSEEHRENTLGAFREVGLAQEWGGFDKPGTTNNASMITQNFARTGDDAFITGVAYSDSDGDRFYDVGEGKSGIVIDWLGNSGGAVNTASAGGYAVAIPTGLNGWARASIDVGATTMRASLAMTGTNVKLDVINGRILASSTDLMLGEGAKDGLLLGLGGNELVGNDAANALTGNKGANDLEGLGGADALKGGAGGDDFVFTTTGHSTPGASDTILDFARGADDIVVASVDANTGRSGDQAFALDGSGSFSAGEIRQRETSSGLLLELNSDGDSTVEMSILLKGLPSAVGASDFVL